MLPMEQSIAGSNTSGWNWMDGEVRGNVDNGVQQVKAFDVSN